MKFTFFYVLNENCIVNFCLVDLNCFIFLSSDQANGNLISKLNKIFANFWAPTSVVLFGGGRGSFYWNGGGIVPSEWSLIWSSDMSPGIWGPCAIKLRMVCVLHETWLFFFHLERVMKNEDRNILIFFFKETVFSSKNQHQTGCCTFCKVYM